MQTQVKLPTMLCFAGPNDHGEKLVSLDIDAVKQYFMNLQDRICTELEQNDSKARFVEDAWQREAGGGGRTRVITDGALIAAIDDALAAQPDVLAKIRDGKVQAAGAVIGAVMKAMKGQADAARVRELVLERAGQL